MSAIIIFVTKPIWLLAKFLQCFPYRNIQMEWTTAHNIMLCREVLVVDPFQARKKTTHRRKFNKNGVAEVQTNFNKKVCSGSLLTSVREAQEKNGIRETGNRDISRSNWIGSACGRNCRERRVQKRRKYKTLLNVFIFKLCMYS